MENEPKILDELLADRTAANAACRQFVDEAAGRPRQAKITAYRELAEDEERQEIIKRSSRAAVDAGLL
jgi:hypothetical protein